MYLLDENMDFPPASSTTPIGIIALGGDLSPKRLMTAYRRGIFPWFQEEDPITWWCPDPRMVLFPDEIKISKSMRSILKKEVFTITYNKDFDAVIKNCAKIKRRGQGEGSWITDDMIKAYCKLHQLGHATSVEVWMGDMLVGGLYGVDLGHVFSGESMFSLVSNASKAGFIALVEKLKQEKYELVDCQVYTAHLESLGARRIPRKDFINILKKVRS